MPGAMTVACALAMFGTLAKPRYRFCSRGVTVVNNGRVKREGIA